jgi:hypothetical protein
VIECHQGRAKVIHQPPFILEQGFLLRVQKTHGFPFSGGL